MTASEIKQTILCKIGFHRWILATREDCQDHFKWWLCLYCNETKNKETALSNWIEQHKKDEKYRKVLDECD